MPCNLCAGSGVLPDFDARRFETVDALPGRPTLLNDLQHDIL